MKELLPSGEDTVGPYYPIAFCSQDRADLLEPVPGTVFRAKGQPIRIGGRILDARGEPLKRVLVEYRQADSGGFLRGPGTRSDTSLDPHFRGDARELAEGRYELRTVKPGALAGSGDQAAQAPHITLTLFADGIARLVTRIFFGDEAANRDDPLLRSLSAEDAKRLIARPVGADPDGLTRYELDIVLAGDGETPFFDDMSPSVSGATAGRTLTPGPTDNTSEQCTPRAPLRPIPDSVRQGFLPWLDALPAIHPDEADLARLGRDRPAGSGDLITLHGRVLDRSGAVRPDILVELWNASIDGRYPHVDDPAELPLDPWFRGQGRVITDSEGRYRVTTIRPGSYLARPDIGRWRPCHVHFSLRGGDARLITQCYFEGDPNNARDPGFILLGDAQERHLARQDGEHSYCFDIVLGGAGSAWR